MNNPLIESSSGDEKAMRAQITKHFSGHISTEEERALREHLAQCEACRKYYNRHLLLSRLDPKGINPEERLAQGLGIRRLMVWPMPTICWSVASAVAALLILVSLWIWPMIKPISKGFQSRGSEKGRAPTSELLVYHTGTGHPQLLTVHKIKADEELAFAYQNGRRYKYLLVFGINEHRQIYWYHPAWLNERQNPRSVSIEQKAGIHELPEAIRHHYQGNHLTLFGIFTNQPLTVRQIEELVKKQSNNEENLPISHSDQRIVNLAIQH